MQGRGLIIWTTFTLQMTAMTVVKYSEWRGRLMHHQRRMGSSKNTPFAHRSRNTKKPDREPPPSSIDERARVRTG